MRARHLQLLAGITLAGALLRFTTLDVQSYWLDEVATVNVLRHGFGDMLSAVSAGESTPHLYYIVAWAWSKAFGTGEVGLRSLSALLGTATIPLVFVLGREVAGRTAGLVAAALCAFNPLLIWYSQEARSYSLMVLLTALSLLAFLRVLDAPSGRRLALWAVPSVAAIATHYFAGFLVGAEALWLLWTLRGRAAFVAVGAVAAFSAALLPLAVHQRSTGAARFISESSVAKRLAQIPKQFAVGYQGPFETVLTVVALLLVAYGLFCMRRAGVRAWLFAGIAVAAIIAPLVLALIGPDYLIARNVIASLVPFAVALSAGFATGRWGIAAAVALCVIGTVRVIGVDTNERYQRDNWRAVGEFLGRADQPRAVIITPASGDIPMLHYLKGGRKTPPGGVNVKEIAFVGLAPRLPGESPMPPRPSQVGAANFTESRRKEGDTYTVVVETSPLGAPITPTVGASPLDGRPAVTVYQP
jgi:uncharacterized membrane protein